MFKPGVQVGSVGGSSAANPILRGIAPGWSCLLRDGKVLLTPGGTPLVHPEGPLLEAIAVEGRSKKGLRLECLSMYSMLCTLKDGVEKARADGEQTCRHMLLADPSLQTCSGPEVGDQLALLAPLEDYFTRSKLPRLLLGQGVDSRQQEENLIALGLDQEVDQVVAFFDRRLSEITPAQHCVVTNCVHLHNVFVLGVLLAESACTPEQYADGLLAVNCCIPGVFGGVTKTDARKAKSGAMKDAELMVRFRDLADASVGVLAARS